MPRPDRKTRILAALATAGLLYCGSASAAPLLDPYAARPEGVGGGLNTEWVQVADDWHFSNYVYQGERIGDTGWGSGFWGVGDIPAAFALADGDPNLVARAGGVSAQLSYANDLYNSTWGSASGWDKDHVREVAPVVATSGQQTNYAARFSGYLYIAEAGLYDFGIFVDDAFSFSLIGAGGSALSVGRDTFIGASGRDFYTLSGANGGGVALDVGYYALQLDYFNRLEAGVLDLGWWLPGDARWQSIDGAQLYAALPPVTLEQGGAVPEPSSVLLLLLGAGLLAWHRGRARKMTAGT